MQARLISRSEMGRTQELSIAKEATIGKGPANSIVLSEKNISRKHARIFFDDAENSYVLEDLNSRNGTRLDGERVRGKERLENVHVITLGNRFEFFFQVVKNEAESINSETVETRPMTKNPVTVIDNDFHLKDSNTVFDDGFVETPESLVDSGEVIAGDADVAEIGSVDAFLSDVEETAASPESVSAFEESDMTSPFTLTFEGLGQTYRLKQGKNIVGRTSRCDIAIKHDTVSRRHACISVKNNVVRIHDLNSKNHTFIGGRRAQEATGIAPHSTLRFGEVDAVLGYEQ